MDKLITYLLGLLVAFAALYSQNVTAVVVACALALSMVVIDFMTGVAASKIADGVGIRSKRLRWSFAKMCVYAVVIAATLAVGIFLHIIDDFINHSPYRSDILTFTLLCVKYEAYVVAWIETVSNLENLLRIWPDNKFLKYIHFVVSVDFIKKIPRLADALKEKDNKPKPSENNNEESN